MTGNGERREHAVASEEERLNALREYFGVERGF
jgi:hypothetical protein